MSDNRAPVILVTANYDLHGDMLVRRGRALDVFNDHSTCFLDVKNVSFYQRMATEPVLELDSTLLVKDSVQLAILITEDRSSESRMFFATLEKRSVPGVISLANVIVKGQVHVKSATDETGFLSLEAAGFFPVTDATVLGHSPANAARKSPVVVVNKAAVSSLALRHG